MVNMPGAADTESLPWFALKVKNRSELQAEAALSARGFRPYLPKCKERRRYSDRFRTVEEPLFPGYLFCRVDPGNVIPVLDVPAVQYILGNSEGPIPVCEDEILSLRKALESGAVPAPFTSMGSRVRVGFGNLQGVEGILVRSGSGVRLVLSVEGLGLSVAVEIDEDQLELL
jgi:transcription antitermination factor NusG